MKDLAWLVGDWASEPSPHSDISLRSTCGWTANGAFLIRKFRAEGKDVVLHAGTEVIGWDPRTRRIRSWVFDSSGGFGENVWLQEGHRWLMQYSGSLGDGSEVSATYILSVVDPDTFTLQPKDRTVNGERQPEVAAITVKRQAAVKAAPKSGVPHGLPQHVLP